MLALGRMSSATQQKARTPRTLLLKLLILIWAAAAVGSCSSGDDQEPSAKKRTEDADPPSQAILEQERAQLKIRVLQNGDTEEPKLRKIINRAEGPLLVAPLAVEVEWRVRIESLQGHHLRSRLARISGSTYNPWNKLQANTYEARVGGLKVSPASIPHKGTFTFEVVNIDRCLGSGFIEEDCRNERSFPPALIRTLNLPYWFLPQGNVDCIIADVLEQLEVNDGSDERERATQGLVDALLRVGGSHQNC